MGAITTGQKKDCPHHFEAPRPSVQKVGQDEPQGDLDGNGYPDHLRRVGERHPVVPRSQELQEVHPRDELPGGDPVPFREAVPRGGNERSDDKDHVENQRRRKEEDAEKSQLSLHGVDESMRPGGRSIPPPGA